MKRIALLALLGPFALLAGCAAPSYVSPVEVTRFIEPRAELGSGTIGIEPAAGTAADSWDYAAVRKAVSDELTKLGYVVTDGTSRQVARISVDRAVTQPDGRRAPVSVGVGGMTGGLGTGVGLGVGIDLRGRQPERIDTELRVAIFPSGGDLALWEGRARFAASANSSFANGPAAAAKLAGALFAGFPGRSGETIEVR